MNIIDLIPDIKGEIKALEDVLDFKIDSIITKIMNRVIVIEFHIDVNDINPLSMMKIYFYIYELCLKIECVAKNESEVIRLYDKRDLKRDFDNDDIKKLMKNLKHAFARYYAIGKKIAEAKTSHVW